MRTRTDHPPLQAVIFDFDGTLAHVDLDFDLMRERVLELAAGHDGTLVDMRTKMGAMPVLELVSGLSSELDERGGDPEAFRLQAGNMIRRMEEKAAAGGQLFPYSRDCMKGLAGHGVGVGVITRNCRAAVLAVFPDILEHCSVFLSRDDVREVKPHPSHVLQALEALGVGPESALMVGDHFLDVETGRRAGMRTAGVASGRISQEALRAAGADMAARDVAALYHMLVAHGHWGRSG